MSVRTVSNPEDDTALDQEQKSVAAVAADRSIRLPLSALLPAVLLIAAFFVYGAVLGFSYPEFSDFALNFGNHPGTDPLSAADILGKYFSMGQGWYRPTSFYLIPYVFRLDYFEPASVMAANIAFFSLAACSVALLVRRAPVAAVFFAATSVLFAPTLYLVPYGTAIDSLYILFGVVFIAAMLAVERATTSRRRRAYRVLAIVSFAAAITSKEIAIVLPFLLVPTLVLLQPRFSWVCVRQALRTAAPYLAVSLIFVVAYKLAQPPSGGVYSTDLSIDKLPGAISLITWTFGFRSPIDTYAHWIPPWSSGEKSVAILSALVLVSTVAIGWRRLRAWRVGLFVLTFLGVAVAIALPGGLPHHAYPLVVLAAVGVLAAARAAATVIHDRLPRSLPVFLGALFAMGTLQIVQGHATYGAVLYSGPQSPFLKASTELFAGGILAPVRVANNPLFVFEDCLGGLHNPLAYYVKAADGEEVSVTKFEQAQFDPRFREAARQGRESFVAQCTGTADPWYRLLRYEPRTRRLVPAAP
ncbi:MAG: hypothetical protein ACR2LK_02260 [Solirubrobacteraceae bacterium]